MLWSHVSWTSAANRMEWPVRVTPSSGRAVSDICVNLPAEHVSACSQTREDNPTSPLIRPPSCLLSFSFSSVSPPSLCSFLLSCPLSLSVPVLHNVYPAKSLSFLLWWGCVSFTALSGSSASIVPLSSCASALMSGCPDYSPVDL